MESSGVGRLVGRVDGFHNQVAKALKRKRVTRADSTADESLDGNAGSDELVDPNGIVLRWGTVKEGTGINDMSFNGIRTAQLDMSPNTEGHSTVTLGLSRGLENGSGSSNDSVSVFGSSRLGPKESYQSRGKFLQLGQTLSSSSCLSEGRVKGVSTVMSMSSEGEPVYLGLAPSADLSCTALFETSIDGVPVVDEGSSSARKTGGGFMPALLRGCATNVLLNINPQYHVGFREGEELTDQRLRMGIRVCTGNGSTYTSGAAGMSDRSSKVCKFRGCSKGSRGASGLCIAHGGGQRCEKQGCNKGAEGRTVYCKAHGGGRRCQSLGCTKSAEGKTDFCIGHGGGRRCTHEGCDKAARGRSGLCIRHGGGKRCLSEGCTKSAEGYSGLCISHGGGRRCQFGGCSKGAQGSTLFCKAHGGGKRCMIQGCSKGAEGSTPLCKGHGGGKRCMHDGGGICTKSVHGGTLYCVAHGGGKRCQVQGCSKSARGKTDFCVRHGGGKRCKVEACGKSAQGSTDFCKAHGGGKRCQWRAEAAEERGEVCDKFARGKTGLCAAHSAQVHQDQRVHGGAVLGPGLSSGLFRGLVSMGTSSSVSYGLQSRSDGQDHSSTEVSGQLFSTFMSGKGTLISSSSMSAKRFCQPSSLVDHFSASGTVTPSFPANFSIGQPLIPPQVLVPVSMLTTDADLSRPELTQRPQTASCGDAMSAGTFVAEGRTLGANFHEGRVRGGGLMALLAGEVSNCGARLDSTTLGMGTSCQPIEIRSQGVAAGEPELSVSFTSESPHRLSRHSSLGEDVAQFLAAPRVNFK